MPSLNRGVLGSGLIALAALGLSVYAAIDDDTSATTGPPDTAGAATTATTDTTSANPTGAAVAAAPSDAICVRVDELLAAGQLTAGQELVSAWQATTTTTSTTSTTSTTTTTTTSTPATTTTTTTTTTSGPPTTTTTPPETTAPPTSTATTTTTAAPSCLVAKQDSLNAATAYAASLCTQISATSSDYEGLIALHNSLRAIDRPQAQKCSEHLLAGLKKAARHEANAGNFERSQTLWGYAHQIDPSIATDREPLPEIDDPESLSHYLRATWSRHRAGLLVLGISLALLFLGLNVIARLGRVFVLTRRWHGHLSKEARWAFVIAYVLLFLGAAVLLVGGLNNGGDWVVAGLFTLLLSWAAAAWWMRPRLSLHFAPWAATQQKDGPGDGKTTATTTTEDQE